MSAHVLATSLVEHVLTLRAEGSFDRLQDLLSPRIAYRLAGDRRVMPYAGAFRGVTDVCVAFQALDTEFEIEKFTLGEPMADANRAAVRWSAGWINRGTRDCALVEGVSHIAFENGLVVDWVDYLDTATASYLAGWMPEMPHFLMSGPQGR